MRIAVDAMGGDNGLSVVVEGSVMAVRDFSIPVLLVGDKAGIEAELKNYSLNPVLSELITIKHASEVVGMGESPSNAVRKKKDSSIRVCFEAVKNDEAHAVVTAGNSGAAMASAIFILKRLKGVERPAIAVTLPTLKDPVVLLDAGGNVDCKATHLAQFAVMGKVYSKYALSHESPRIGLLSNAEEEGKGNELTREAHEILKTAPINYLGQVEGRDIYKGDVDVVVTDGFVGNVALKLSEGLLEAFVGMLREEIKSSFLSRLGYILASRAFKRLKKRVDYAEFGGAPLLGINGICIISHGSSSAKAIMNAIIKAHKYAKGDVNAHQLEELTKYNQIMSQGHGEVKAGLERRAQ